MPLDPEYLRRHYASLSDEALRELDRGDLVEAAQRIFDEEVLSRTQSRPQRAAIARPTPNAGEELAPDWLEDAAEAFTCPVRPGNPGAAEADHAREVLEAADIPAHVELVEDPDVDRGSRWRVLVPGKLIHRADSVLERDIFNEHFESDFRTHLELLTDEELRTMDPEYAFCGLYDKLERINRAYDEELERRGLTE